MSEYFHVGILVLDVEAAMREYGDALGLAFIEPVRVRGPRLRESTPVPRETTLDVTITFSREGPPYHELMGATGDGLYASANAGLHHLGLWTADCEARRAELLARGLVDEAVQYDDEGTILAAFLRMPSPPRTRIELIPESRRAGVEAWLAGDGWGG